VERFTDCGQDAVGEWGEGGDVGFGCGALAYRFDQPRPDTVRAAHGDLQDRRLGTADVPRRLPRVETGGLRGVVARV
jgi:hypothetical protein